MFAVKITCPDNLVSVLTQPIIKFYWGVTVRTVNSGHAQFTVTVNPDMNHQLFIICCLGQPNVVYLGVS